MLNPNLYIPGKKLPKLENLGMCSAHTSKHNRRKAREGGGEGIAQEGF